MHYLPSSDLAFSAVDRIMTSIPYGYLLRYVHANGASFMFICLYIHIFKAIYYSSYTGKHKWVWYIGVLIFILSMATAFIGYVLPWGQMSLWGATVITSLLTVLPGIGHEFVIYVWGGYSVGEPTLQRFFSLHFVLPFILAALAASHITVLHLAGSNNPTGMQGVSTISFWPTFGIKDLFVFLILFALLAYLFVLHPNLLGHPDNYIQANAMVTPPHIVPEWYFLPFYAILRSIPNKVGGVIAMAASLLILFALPHIHTSTSRNTVIQPMFRLVILIWAINFIFLGWIGQLPVDDPYTKFGLFSTIGYFSLFSIIPALGWVEGRFCK